MLWLPIILFLPTFSLILAPTFPGDAQTIVVVVLAAIEMVLLLSLVLTAQYCTDGLVALPPDAETERAPLEGHVEDTARPSLSRILLTQYALSASTPFSAWVLGLSLVLAFGVLLLSTVDGGTATFGLNIIIPTCTVAFIIFLLLAYTDATSLDETHPLIYRHSLETSQFVRTSLRSIYPFLIGFLSMSLFIGATLAGHNWIYYCYPSSYGCRMRAPVAHALFLQSVLGYALSLVLFFGMIVPLVMDTEVVPAGFAPNISSLVLPVANLDPPRPALPTTYRGSDSRSRFVFNSPLFILSWVLIFPGFYFGASDFDYKVGGGAGAMLGFFLLLVHHFFVSIVYLCIRDFDPETYLPTLHTKTACRFYVWTLIFPLLSLLSGAVDSIDMLSRPWRDNRHHEAELVCDLVASLIIILMMVTAVYPSSVETRDSVRNDESAALRSGESVGDDAV